MLRDLFTPESVSLSLRGASKDDVLLELVALLRLDERAGASLHRMLRRRESHGSTGVGRGVAIPHARSLAVDRVRLAYGRHEDGVGFDAIDARPVRHLFLIVAPPVELSSQYLPVLGRVAQFVKEPDVIERLGLIVHPDEFFSLLREKGH
ncbi:MAG TPA: PTS sugar transporter subunit IIA [Gemmatimonadales bacterium]|nr:PTS sugar transporter subunit IIA [Gemmatimonadales bacterium]